MADDEAPVSDQQQGAADVKAGTDVVALPSAAIMDNVRDVAGRVGSHLGKTSYRNVSSFVPGQVETIDVTNPTRLDQQLGFPAHSVIIDNPTTQWFFIQSAQRFAAPGLHNAVWQIPKASTQAQGQWRAPAGIAQPAIEEGTQITLTFCEAFLMPSPGIIIIAPGVGPAVTSVHIQDISSDQTAIVGSYGNQDNNAAFLTGLVTTAFVEAYNGANFDRLRTASAANLAAQLGIGALLSAPPGMWSVVSTPAAGAQATASRAAGAAGVRHVAWAVLVSWGAIAAPGAAALTWNLRDGATGAGTIIASGVVAIQAAVAVSDDFFLASLNIPGTAATAMTLEFSAGLANLLEGVTLLGYDAS